MPQPPSRSLGVLFKLIAGVLILSAFIAGRYLPRDGQDTKVVEVSAGLKGEYVELVREYGNALLEWREASKESDQAQERFNQSVRNGRYDPSGIRSADMIVAGSKLRLANQQTMSRSRKAHRAATKLLDHQSEMLGELTDLPQTLDILMEY